MTTKPFGIDRLRAMPAEELWTDESRLSCRDRELIKNALEELNDAVMRAVSPHLGDFVREVLIEYMETSSVLIEWLPHGPRMRICLGESFEFGLDIPIIDCFRDDDWDVLDANAGFTEAEVIEICEVMLTSLRPLHQYIDELVAKLEHRKKNPGTKKP